ncbi:MAG: hypothetical protein HQ478_15570 [Chloroflexi bacterium]|nr:hypothetical protein [Chloroflexota bacterium]
MAANGYTGGEVDIAARIEGARLALLPVSPDAGIGETFTEGVVTVRLTVVIRQI